MPRISCHKVCFAVSVFEVCKLLNNEWGHS